MSWSRETKGGTNDKAFKALQEQCFCGKEEFPFYITNKKKHTEEKVKSEKHKSPFKQFQEFIHSNSFIIIWRQYTVCMLYYTVVLY